MILPIYSASLSALFFVAFVAAMQATPVGDRMPFIDELMPRRSVLEVRDIPYSSGIIRDATNGGGYISDGQLSDNGDGTWTRELWLNVYSPTKEVRQLLPDPEKLPVVLVVFGGGLYNGNREKETIVDLAKRFAQRGYVALTLDYMLLRHDVEVGDHYYISPAMREDVNAPEYDRRARTEEAVRRNLAACVSWINTHDDAYHMDVDRLAIVGSSAGSMIMLDMFLDQDYVRQPHVAQFITDDEGTLRYTAPKALVSLWGWLRRTGENRLGPRPGLRDYVVDAANPALSFESHRAKYVGRALHSYDQDILDSSAPSVFFHHSTGDPVIPYLESIYLKSRLDALGVENRLDLLFSPPRGDGAYVGHAKFGPFYEQGHFQRVLHFLDEQLGYGVW